MTDIARLKPDNILFIYIDLQKSLLTKIAGWEKLVSRNILLLESAKVLGLPYLVTTQYKKGLGDLAGSFSERLSAEVLDKTSFSCALDQRIADRIARLKKEWVVISGIETHICVLQTTLDLLRNGYRTAVVTDAVGARGEEDHQRGLIRMERSGALMVTGEMLIYELLVRSDSENFKKILPLVKAQ